VTIAVETRSAGRPSPVLRAKRRRQRLTVLAFLTPWLLGVAIFFVYPLIDTIYLSFTRYDLLSPPKWIGLTNYRFMFTKDPQVVQAAYNTLWLVAILVPARMLFGLAVATLVTRLKSGLGVFRTVFYLPALVPPVAGVLAFVFLFNPATGPVNQILGALGLPQPLWFNDPALSKPSLVMLGLWGIGDLMIIFLASLLDVPKEQYEAAALDGVNPWQRFRYVTLPNISPVLMFAAITGVIAALQYFTEAVVAASVASGQATTGGGNSALLGYPEGSTLTYAQWLYVMGFKNYYLGYASALAVVMFVVSLGVTLILLRRARSLVYGAEGTR
jgi:multiple sugar transport system permease protein